MEVLIALAVVAIASLLCEGVKYLINLWGSKQKMPDQVKAEMSETDEEMIEKTKNVIANTFGDSVIDKIATSSNKERIDLMADFATTLSKEYGLDISVDITVSDISNCGYYNWEEKKAVFNIAMMMVDKDNEHFAYCVRETLDTIIHELRHAVQHKAIHEEGFWNVDEARRIEWANNMLPENYIQPSVDRKGYFLQPIEKDAATFANAAMEGVC